MLTRAPRNHISAKLLHFQYHNRENMSIFMPPPRQSSECEGQQLFSRHFFSRSARPSPLQTLGPLIVTGKMARLLPSDRQTLRRAHDEWCSTVIRR